MLNFYKKNKHALSKNFQSDVLDHVNNKPFANDPDMRQVMFQEYVKDEHNNYPERYINYTSAESNVGSTDGAVQFDPKRRVVPKVRMPETPDYGVSEPERVEPTIGIPDIITQEEIDKIRETHPDEAATMERLIEMSPAYRNQTGSRRGLTEEDRVLMDGYLKILPKPGGTDLVGPLGKLSGILKMLGKM